MAIKSGVQALCLMDYLSSWEIPEEAKVLDIGCGWGLAGIYLAKHYQAQVTGLDIDEGSTLSQLTG